MYNVGMPFRRSDVADIPAEFAPDVLEAAAQILLRRKEQVQADGAVARAALGIGEYGEYVHSLKPARHHQVWVQKIHDLIEGRIPSRRLLIVAPPASAKSTWISQIFPSWFLGKFPDKSITFVTSTDDRAKEFLSVVRSTIEGNERHRQVFPSSKAQPHPERGWSNDGLYLKGLPQIAKDPNYRAIGYQGRILGARMDGLILDDPLSQTESESDLSMAGAKTYYDMTLSTRLHPWAWQIAIMTRWHEGDMAAYLMAKRPEWDVVFMPAIGYWGDEAPLWPEYHSVAFLEDMRSSLGGAVFEAVYQGNPLALGGDVFQKREWFRAMPTLVPGFVSRLAIYQFWDTAFSEKQSADYSVCVTLGLDRTSGAMYVLSVFRDRLTVDGLMHAVQEQCQLWRPGMIGIEEPAFKQAVVQDLRRRLIRSGISAAVVTVKPSKDKVTRARLPASRAEAGLIYVDNTAPWTEKFVAECMAFPNAEHDDQVDALSGAVQLAIEKSGIGFGSSVYGLETQKPHEVEGTIDVRTAAPVKTVSKGEVKVTWLNQFRERKDQRYSIARRQKAVV